MGDKASEVDGRAGEVLRVVGAEGDDGEAVPEAGDDGRPLAVLVREDDHLLTDDVFPVVIVHGAGKRFADPVKEGLFHLDFLM